MCASLSLIILNGLNNGDKQGAFTFVSPNGDSVIDYCLVSECLLSSDLDFSILSRVDSWHMPISLVIKANNELQINKKKHR